MKTFIILSCYTSLEMLFAFLGGIVLTIIVAIVVRLREQNLMREISDLKKMSHFIQRYYWLMKKGKITEAQKKALKKTVSVFANRIMKSERSVVENVLATFTRDVFTSIRTKIDVIHLSYKNQFVSIPRMDGDGSMDQESPFHSEEFVSQEEAVKKIENAFEEAGLS